MDDRLTELESRVAFQDHAIQELSDVIARQQREIDQIRLQLEALRAQLVAMGSLGATNPREEPPPPHY